jgi:hypothetical protein
MARKINGFAVYWRTGRIMVERTDLTGREFHVAEDGKHVRSYLTFGVAEDDVNAMDLRRAAEEFLRRGHGADHLADR